MLHVEAIGMTVPISSPKGERPLRAEDLLARAGRVCYRSERTDDVDRFISARIREGHESIIEHVSITFEIDGISRSALAQLARHRIASYSVESMRRVDMARASFVMPPSVRGDQGAEEIFTEAVKDAKRAYMKLRQLGIRKEDCRFVLPIATETRLVMTMNLRSLRNFFETRCNSASQWEIRELAERMLKIAYKIVPSAFEDLYTRYLKGRDY